ncbi:aminopeptidase [Chitinimonas lacunae]|uniref:Aminopeptidase n=1 Tax=Chitinimonas lacunae TaxID=1963018 RepID=A0ABV8ML82_9NEIS
MLLLMWLSGCASLSYLGQAASGQAEVMERARPIDALLADPTTPGELADKLRFARDVRRFAIDELGLPDNESYTRYADLGRPYPVWNIVATQPLDLTPVQSCFPVAGCLDYRGYYREEEARRHAESLIAKGMDVFWYGVPAYSTLGWFADPLLNSTIRYGRADLARLIFHELAHQQVYVKDDSAFNEAFATAVELEGFERWLRRHGDEAIRNDYQRNEARRAAFRDAMSRTRQRLLDIYQGPGSDATKLAAKQSALEALAAEYAQLKARYKWMGYDAWFDPLPNNAHFASVATYHRLVPAFRALFAEKEGNWTAFYEAVRALAAQDKASRHAALESRLPLGTREETTAAEGAQ